MEILGSGPRQELDVIEEEDDEVYEKIEAPKFVDFTVPDRFRPDDKSWFCLRIGCDQQHEEVNPDALYRSFMLRVMAARSPNVKLQKALKQQSPRSIKKCPRSAPAKSVKDRVPRFSTITSIPFKMAIDKLKCYPVSSLRSTPINTKAKVQPLTSNNKALTTPRTKKCLSNHEPFQSVKHQREPVVVPKNRSVAKALFSCAPKKNDEANKILNPEICDGMKKLSIGAQSKNTSKGLLCSKTGEKTSISLKKRNKGVSVEGKICSEKINLEENLSNTAVLLEKDSRQQEKTDSTNYNNSEEDSKENTKAAVVENVAESDDNKENDSSSRNFNSSTTNSEIESVQYQTSENIPQKEMRAPSKNIKGHDTQAGKVKRTTNPKPFRLRTNERGILKEANLERKIQLEAQKDKSKNAIHEKNNQNISEGQKSQPSHTRTPRVRYVESRYATSIHKSNKLQSQNTETEETKIKIVKATAKSSVTAAKNATKSQVDDKTTTNTTCSKGKKPFANKTEPTFHRLHVPKSCTRRQETTMP